MIRLFFAALLPSLLAIITLPALALSTSGRPAMQEKRQPQQAVTATVGIHVAKFDPASSEIKPGEVVLWENDSDRDHEIVGDKNEFKSGTIKPGKSWSYTFEKAGTYKYHCALHPRAKGVVKVQQ